MRHSNHAYYDDEEEDINVSSKKAITQFVDDDEEMGGVLSPEIVNFVLTNALTVPDGVSPSEHYKHLLQTSSNYLIQRGVCMMLSQHC